MMAKIEWYQEVLEQEPSSRVFFPLSRLLVQVGREEDALTVLRNGLVQHPDFLEARLFLIQLLHEQGLATGCLAEVAKVASLFEAYPSFWDAWAESTAGVNRDLELAMRFMAATFRHPDISLCDVFASGLGSLSGGITTGGACRGTILQRLTGVSDGSSRAQIETTASASGAFRSAPRGASGTAGVAPGTSETKTPEAEGLLQETEAFSQELETASADAPVVPEELCDGAADLAFSENMLEDFPVQMESPEALERTESPERSELPEVSETSKVFESSEAFEFSEDSDVSQPVEPTESTDFSEPVAVSEPVVLSEFPDFSERPKRNERPEQATPGELIELEALTEFPELAQMDLSVAKPDTKDETVWSEMPSHASQRERVAAIDLTDATDAGAHDAADVEEPTLRTRSMANVLAEQGDFAGALEIYQELESAAPSPNEAKILHERVLALVTRVNGSVVTDDDEDDDEPAEHEDDSPAPKVFTVRHELNDILPLPPLDEAGIVEEGATQPVSETGDQPPSQKKLMTLLESLADRLEARARA